MSLPGEIAACVEAYADGLVPDSGVERAAVKAVLAELQRVAPGKAVELRIPPYAAVQVVEGPAHRRGTPKALVELNARTLLQLAAGVATWADLKARGQILASGERSDLGHLFPCF